ncbi:chaperone protein Dnaj 11 chloroplastic [Phtheirospermum japonicum]|uniref:Chaperone protein Dnaj 11 chloroplastic n=1 Tax=Phtheirospermum japonicum TaxID=374723 RepID=A0A830C6J6_9LAMI|nr:chaperone protein Dnaj 11 chloroplastic [Phtheirospermum japonicum]
MSVRAAVAEVAQPSSAAAAARRSLYEVLRIRRNASQVEIKTAYRTLAKLYHPAAAASSSSSSDGRDFIEIHKAYATLSDPDARAVYDLNLNVDSKRRPGRGRFYPTRRWETDQCW